ncbi:MAG: putative drug exporter of the superfamily [Solirubrobacteraceae bacterium]|nr:putative drug exporter of the superfamily [Solirubrobacteraceae bacterium]
MLRRRRDPATTTHGPFARGYAALVVALRHLVVLAWIAAAVAASVSLPSLDSAPAAPREDRAARGGDAAAAQALEIRRFGFPLATDTAVVQRDPRGLSGEARRRQLAAARAVSQGQARDPALRPIRGAIPIDDSIPRSGSIGGRATTAVTYLYFDPRASLDSRSRAAQRYARVALGPRAAVVGVTGAGPAREAQFRAIQDALPLIEAASIALIALVVGLAFRSLGAPLVALGAAGVSYLIAIRVLPWLGERAGVTVPKEIEPIIVVLLLGLVTDYSVFFLSAARRELARGQQRRRAARTAVAEVAPSVITAGLIVAAGTASLVVGRLEFFRAFGPGLAATTLISLAVSATLVPALVGIFGERLFGRSLRREAARAEAAAAEPQPPEDEVPAGLGRGPRRGPLARLALSATRPRTALRRLGTLARDSQTSVVRVLIARIASSPPLALVIALVATAALGYVALDVRSTQLGLGFVRSLPPDSEVRRAAEAAGKGFADGIVGPTEVDVLAPGVAGRRAQLARLEELVRRERGVAAVVGPGEQLPPPAPQATVARDGGAARLAVVFDRDPLGAPAIDRLDALRQRMPTLLRQAGLDPATRVAYGGETALAGETVDRVLSDLWRVGIVALLVNLVLLALFMRALVAPLYLVGASVLGLVASLGATTWLFQHVLGYEDLTYYVPFAAAVLLVALGSDYNVFIAGRIWREARRMRLREAIAVATPQASKAIRVAGLALAASFALLAIVPVRSFREFAFVMAAGVLIDTFVVRSLLVPALTSLFGERAWWPGRRVRLMSAREFVQRVAGRAGLGTEHASRATDAALATLSERITRSETRVLAAQLPRDLRHAIAGGARGPERFGADEFVRRVGDREGVPDADALEHARAVLATLDEAVAGDLAYVRAQLSADYAPLFEDGAEVDARG